MTAHSLDDACRRACAEMGVIYKDVPIDGRWHPADIEGDPRGRGDARIRLFHDGRGGHVYSWKADNSAVFFVDDDNDLTDAEKQERAQQQARVRQQADDDQRQRRVEAATKAGDIWRAAKPLSANHPYLLRKGITPVSTLRELPADELASLLG